MTHKKQRHIPQNHRGKTDKTPGSEYTPNFNADMFSFQQV